MPGKSRAEKLRKRIRTNVEIWETPDAVAGRWAGESIGISVGMRPSASLDLGELASLFVAGHLAKSTSIDTEVRVVNGDLALPSRVDRETIVGLSGGWVSSRTASFFRYLRTREGKPFAQAYGESLFPLLARFEEEQGVNMDLQALSRLQARPEYRERLKRFCERSGSASRYLGVQARMAARTHGGIFLYPICSSCRTADRRGAVYTRGEVRASCDPCEKGWSFDLLDTGQELSVHYYLDALHDLSGEGKRVRVVPGEQAASEGGLSAVEKIAGILSVVREGEERLPVLYVAPHVVDSRGGKPDPDVIRIGASQFSFLTREFGRSWEYIGKLMEEGVRELSYRAVAEQVLSQISAENVK